MILAWLSWSNPVALWWLFLVAVSAVNVVLWFKLCAFSVRTANSRRPGLSVLNPWYC